MSGAAPPFKEAQLSDPTLTPLVLFYNTFYDSVFQYVPEAKFMFKNNIRSQGRMLAQIIKFVISNLRDKDSELVRKSLIGLAVGHNSIGVTADMVMFCFLDVFSCCDDGGWLIWMWM